MPRKPRKNAIENLVLFRENKEQDEPIETGKMLPHFQRCGFPLQKPPADYLLHTRHDGALKIEIIAHPTYGMPYGADVLTLLWCFSAATRQNSRIIRFEFGADILREMHLPPQTYNYRMIAASLRRIFGSMYFFEWGTPQSETNTFENKKSLIDGLNVWFTDGNKDKPIAGKTNQIELSPFAWKWLKSAPVLETAPAYAMRKTPGAIQLYLVIADRGPRLRGPGDLVDIPLTGRDGLDKQIGGVTYEGQEGQKRWRQLLRTWLAQIRVGWPECPAELVNMTGTPYGKAKGKKGWYLRVEWFAKKNVDNPDS